MKEKGNGLYYFGDMDYEGILIFETLAGQFSSGQMILPFVKGYRAMLDVAEKIGVEQLPRMKEGQNSNIGELFYSYFEAEDRKRMEQILQAGQYIPQEILATDDF